MTDDLKDRFGLAELGERSRGRRNGGTSGDRRRAFRLRSAQASVERKSAVVVFDRFDRWYNHFSPAPGARICVCCVAALLKARGRQSLAARFNQYSNNRNSARRAPKLCRGFG